MEDIHQRHPDAWDGLLILGEIYLKENKADSAITCLAPSVERFRKEGDTYMMAAAQVKLVKALIMTHDFVTAGKQFEECKNICVQNAYNDHYLNLLKERSNLLQSQGLFAEALRNEKSYIAYKDSLDQINRFNRITELNAKYESEKRESEIAKQQQQIQNKNSLIALTMVGLGALIVITILILYNLMRKRKLNAILKNQNTEIRIQRQKIISSLKYAKKIQRSILVPEQVIKDVLPESFIFFKPKDIVSGDFYWFKRIEDKVILATVDCTGHGVPGAFLSLIANSQLEKAVSEKHLTDPGDIMKFVHEQILILLNQDNLTQSVQDGLDITICLIDPRENKLRFAGSGNAIYLVRGNEITELKTENYGLAGDFFARKSDPLKAFVSKEINYTNGTDLFMLTDGYLDQFGGREKKKLNKPRFRELLRSLSKTNLHNAHQKCEQFFESWRGGLPQLDDVLVIGTRL
jgi:serine phosphatase RsbU (regulator of sigma subunit)